MSSFDISVTMEVKTCPAGHLYAIPHWSAPYAFGCPFCTYQRLEAVRAEKAKQENVIRGLRSALKVFARKAGSE